jgi:ribosome-associated protein
MQAIPAARGRRWGFSRGRSLRKPAGEDASIEAPYQRFSGGLRHVKLDQYLKWQGLVSTGGEAKVRIQRGDVRVNGAIETRRGRRLASGDAVAIDGRERLVTTLRGSGAPPPGSV